MAELLMIYQTFLAYY